MAFIRLLKVPDFKVKRQKKDNCHWAAFNIPSVQKQNVQDAD